VRPPGKAACKPGVWYDHRQVGDGRGLTEKCLGQAQAFFSGRAEPAPPRGGQARVRDLAEKTRG